MVAFSGSFAPSRQLMRIFWLLVLMMCSSRFCFLRAWQRATESMVRERSLPGLKLLWFKLAESLKISRCDMHF